VVEDSRRSNQVSSDRPEALGVLTFDEIVVGSEFELDAQGIQPDQVTRYLRACGHDEADLYGDAVPPLMLAMVCYLKGALPKPWPAGGLHARERIVIHEALKVGQPFTVRAHVKEKRTGRRHRFVVFDIEVRYQDVTSLQIERTMTWTA